MEQPPSGTTSLLRVTARDAVADDVIALTLEHPDGRRLPDWAPGAHIDLILPTGLTRQYSLCGNRWDAHTFRIAVRRESDGRGGSAYVHDVLAVGDLVGVGGPRNNFRMVPAAKYVFVAGGIGITPMLPMIHQAELVGATWKLVYTGHSRATMPFTDELAPYGDRVSIVATDEGGRIDIGALLADAGGDSRVYVCGPCSMLDDAVAAATTWPPGRLRVERFRAERSDTPARTEPFVLELARSGRTLPVTPERTVLDALADAGVGVLSSCREGLCGTCETTVLAGEPEHRDSILDDDERDSGTCMFVCVSRSRSDRLVLDL
ncbi:PDR/VanB family oxidoreductase [Gordonia rhizosphera]|uniref:Putative oxidoreductase n=1 Tax=Gordonia rhizosphera NBRC 16068 TaxID=1108045 RepID=K6WSD5_9ACTN|nr:PDR/VanB family oxidoreductase [Gordonia rhizosphera]GAB89474.1 putative oxidoreductase [Gordonia rhizosphera NBRC 16068]